VAAVAPLALLLAFPPLMIARGAGGMLLVLLFPAAFGLAGFAHVAAAHGAGLGAFLVPLRAHPLAPVADPIGTLAGLGCSACRRCWPCPSCSGATCRCGRWGPPCCCSPWPRRCSPCRSARRSPRRRWPPPRSASRRRRRCCCSAGAGRSGSRACCCLRALVTGGLAVAAQPGRWLEAPAPTQEERALAAAIAGRRDLLIDLAAAPEIAALRGGGRGLLRPGDDRFRLMAMSGRLTAEAVAVRDPSRDAPRWRPDRVHAAFPELHARGAPGYRLSREIGAWRIYERES
jgi:hypothetical protein